MKDVQHKPVKVEQNTGLDFSDPLEEEDDDDLIVEITDPKEIDKLQLRGVDFLFHDPGMPCFSAFDDVEEWRWYFDQFLKREQITRQKQKEELNK